jgi:SAM-dependent methyltransferase
MSLALPDASFDAVVSGLVLNSIPDPAKGLNEMVRVARAGGVVAAYVWDYQEKMELSRKFWDTAKSVDPSAEAHDEGRRFVVCRPENLRALFLKAGLGEVASGSIEIEMVFDDFTELWSLLLKAQGPFAAFFAKLDDEKREMVKSRFQEGLRADSDGRIRMDARAWTVKGTRLPR